MRTLVLAGLSLSATLTLPPITAASDWLQFNLNGQHTGNNQQETTINQANVSNLHVRYQVTLPSIADGAPAFLQGVPTAQGVKDLLFLTTRGGHLLALDAATGATVWSQRPATGPKYTTSSPAIDPNRQFVYAYALDGKVHKYRVADGTELGGAWPQVTTLKPNVEEGSSALSLVTTVGGTSFLYASHGGYPTPPPGDEGDYQGHVTAINLATDAQNVFNTNCSNLACHLRENGSGDCSQAQPGCPQVQSAVWARAGVVYSPGLDRIFFATGNGVYDANTGGFDWGDSVLAIHPDGTGPGGGLPVDSYTPAEFQILQDDDADLGSTSPAILPPVPGSNIAHLGVQAQKQPGTPPFTTAKIRLLNLANLSGSGGPGHVGGEIQKIDTPRPGGVLTALAVWVNPSDSSVWVFCANYTGISGLKIVVDGLGNPSMATQWTNATGGTSPILANGVLYYATYFAGMQALDPTTGSPLWSDGQTIGGIHLQSPILVNGGLYITDQSSRLWAFDTTTPSISIDDVAVSPGNAGLTDAIFTVSLAVPSSATITVKFATANGTATAGIDYLGRSGTLSFPPGTTMQTVTVPVIGDRTLDADKTFFVNLSGATNAPIIRAQGVGTIQSSNPPGLSVNDVAAVGGTTAMFTVTLSPINPSQTVTVNYATADGTAAAGSDYQATSGTLTFPPGTATQPVGVAVSIDPTRNTPETFFLNLSGATNAAIAYSQGVGTIGSSCAAPLVIVPDGRLTSMVIPGGATVWLGVSLRIGGSYSVEFKNATGSDVPPGALTAFRGDDGCSGGSTLLASDTTGIDPREETGAARVSFSATGTNPFFRLRLANDLGTSIAYTGRVSETTMFSPAWSTNGSFDTFYSLQNTTGMTLNAALTLYDTAGAMVSTFNLSIPAAQTSSANTAAMGVARSKVGTVRLTHDGPPGSIVGEAAIANFTINPAYVQPVKFEAARDAR